MSALPHEHDGSGAFGRLLRRQRLRAGLTLEALAERAGCRKGYLSMLERGRRSAPKRESFIAALEAGLGVEAGTLLAAAQWEATPSPVRALLRTTTDLDALFASGALHRALERAAPNIHLMHEHLAPVPIINQVAAGELADFTDLDYPARTADAYLRCPATDDEDAFAARIVGDSMEPEYREGDVVVFSPEAPVRSGSDCFFRLLPDHEVTFKRAEFSGDDPEWISLVPLNRRYSVRRVHRESIGGMFAAVYVVRRAASNPPTSRKRE